MGLKMVELYVFSTNERAMHLYEKVGFRVTGKIPKEICRRGTFIDHIIMVKELCRTPISL
jgi:RimJ/RimL family protein N-acetyltransferase